MKNNKTDGKIKVKVKATGSKADGVLKGLGINPNTYSSDMGKKKSNPGNPGKMGY